MSARVIWTVRARCRGFEMLIYMKFKLKWMPWLSKRWFIPFYRTEAKQQRTANTHTHTHAHSMKKININECIDIEIQIHRKWTLSFLFIFYYIVNFNLIWLEVRFVWNFEFCCTRAAHRCFGCYSLRKQQWMSCRDKYHNKCPELLIRKEKFQTKTREKT